MKNETFSSEQETSIRTIVREEITVALSSELTPIWQKLTEHDHKLDVLTDRVDNLPTKSDMLDMFDKYLGAYNRLDTEVTVLSGISERHDKDIQTIKKHVQLM